MTFLHLSDLHLGKRVNDYSMLEDQAVILQQILDIVAQKQPDGILIAGDIYDKPVPPTGAVELFDRFLTTLVESGATVFVISGNHDSAERIAFGGALLSHSGVHLSKVYDGDVVPISMQDDFGTVDVFLLPFVKPTTVARRLEDDSAAASYTAAVQSAIAHMPIDPTHRNVLVTHQFVTGALTCDSEELSVGGSDNVDATVFDPFDYVALGHLHGPQHVLRDTIRYCGTPLKYSFSEAAHQKSVTLIELRDKGDVTIDTLPLTPPHDLLEIKGTYMDVTAREFYENSPYRDAYMHITLTDEDDVPDAIAKLRVIYPLIMKLDYDNRRTRENAVFDMPTQADEKTPLELFEDLFTLQNNQPMSDDQRALVAAMIEHVWEDDA